MTNKATVAVIKTTPETVLPDIKSMMIDAGLLDSLPKDKTVILKDNISWHFPFLSANTTPWQLEATIQCLQENGYGEVTAVQNETVVTDAYKGEKLNKYVPIFRKYKIPVLYNFKPEDITWQEYKPKGETLVLHKIFPHGINLPTYFHGKSIIHLPTVKCHIYTNMTGAMKNAFGGLLNTRRHYTHSVIHETLVDLLMIQKEIHAGIFTVMDGTLCGNGPGPRTMFPVEKDYMLASSDSVAIDAISAKLMGFNPMKDIKCIRLAHERGLGVGDPAHIHIIGEDISNVNFNFSVGDNAASRIGDLMWFGPMRPFQYLFFHTPLVYLFVFGSYFYHDKIWWPLKGVPRMKKVLKESKWGRLFESYPE
ncbi:DUF362 domain-containing protein [bacterium]|nr:DUF362 domain-containing protein [candidate division CSSED10-310 bacterium]